MNRSISLPELRAASAPHLRHADSHPAVNQDRPDRDRHAPLSHRTELSDGSLQFLVPTPATPGFDLCSARCFQLWLALYYHAQEHGDWQCPDELPDDGRYDELSCMRPKGLTAEWTVDLLARTCGVDPRTAGRGLAELRDLGWVRYSVKRDTRRQFIGIVYVLQVPPTKLSTTAAHRYQQQIDKKKEKLAEEESRLKRGQPDYAPKENIDLEAIALRVTGRWEDAQ